MWDSKVSRTPRKIGNANKAALFRYNCGPIRIEGVLKLSLTLAEKKVLWFVLFLSLLGLITLWFERH